MQPVRKKAKRKLKTSHLVLLLAGLVVLSGALYILQKKPNPKPPASEDHSVTLIDREESSLLKMEVTNSKGEIFTLVRYGERFKVEGRDDFEPDEMEIALMTKDLTLLIANELAGTAHTDEASLAQLGLGAKAPRVKAFYEDGSSLTLVFGDSAKTEIPSDYLLIENDNNIYTVSPETRQHFDRALASLHVISRINFNEELVDSLVISGEENFRIGHEEGLWELKEPYLYPLDGAKVSSLLTAIGKMRFAQYYGAENELDLPSLGLSPAKRVITFELAESVITDYDREGAALGAVAVKGQQISIALGDNIGLIGLYCLYDGKVFQATNASMGFLKELTILNLLSPNPVTLPLNRVSRLEVTKNGETRDYSIDFVEKILPNNEIEQDIYGNILYEPLVFLNGEEIPSTPFVQEYLKLMALKRSGRLKEGFVPESETPRIAYTLFTLNGKREVAFFPYDDLHDAMRVNGVFIDYIQKATVDGLSL